MKQAKRMIALGIAIIAICAGLILFEMLHFDHPRWWILCINIVAMAVNVHTVMVNVERLRYIKARRAAGWLVG